MGKGAADHVKVVVLMIFSYLPWVAYVVIALMVVSTVYMNG